MARCLLQGNEAAEGRRLVYPLLFDENKQHDLPAALVGDARYLAALGLARDYLEPASARPVDDAPATFAASPLAIPLHLDKLGLAEPARPKADADKNAAAVLEVRAGQDKQPPVVVKADLASQPARSVFEQLAKAGGLRIEFSPEADTTLADRSLRLCLHDWPLHLLLGQAADSFDLVCQVEGDLARVLAPDECTAAQLARTGHALAGRALRAAIQHDPAHLWAGAAFLEAANGATAEGNVAEAMAWLERLIREATYSPYAGAAHYNLAKLQLAKRELARARRSFFRVIDERPGHQLALRARIHIGQMFLEEGDVGQALVQLRRTQTVTLRSPYQPLATLVLAAAFIEDGQPDQTRAVLAKQRSFWQKEPVKPTAAFLDAYAQYLLAKANQAVRREASELLNALGDEQDENLLGSVGHFLCAEAYRELGLYDLAERLLRRAAPRAGGTMALRLEYLLADTLLRLNRAGDAAGLFEKLSERRPPFRTLARWQLAQLDLADKRYPECVQRCQELWPEQALLDAPALLRLWGTALEATGDFAGAAQCFAGKAPTSKAPTK
jgi:tetratricopeptide (TPR) repeat protein